MSNYKDALVLGVAKNDIKGSTRIMVEGKSVTCPYYMRWLNLVRREHSRGFQTRSPTYSEATVHKEWLLYSTFKLWMESQIWEGLELDKDILVQGNKHYSPETCAFVPKRLNKVLSTNRGKARSHSIGVSYIKKRSTMVNEYNKPYNASVWVFEGDRNYQASLGSFLDEASAHRAWQWAKANEIEKAVAWYATQECFRTDVAEALTKRVWDLRTDHSNNIETTIIL